MNMKKPSVALDLDGVICNTPEVIENELRRRGYNALFETYHPVVFGINDSRDLVNDVVDDIFTNRMDEIEPCDKYMINTLKEIDIVANIVIVTARNEEFGEATREWLDGYFPDINLSLVHKPSKEKTAYIKEKGFLCFVEDRLRTADEASRAGIYTYLINKRWNVGRRTHRNIIRIKDLSTFQSLLPSKHIFQQYIPNENKNKDLLGC
jgi:uncharacterized HAD superfamily protein